MYPSSLRIRASSRLSLEDGIVTSRCCALAALRKRVRKSEMGSVIDIQTSPCLRPVGALDRVCGHPARSNHSLRSLPTRLRHAGDVSVVRQFAQADPADAELAVHGTGATATATAGVAAGLVLGCPLLADAL